MPISQLRFPLLFCGCQKTIRHAFLVRHSAAALDPMVCTTFPIASCADQFCSLLRSGLPKTFTILPQSIYSLRSLYFFYLFLLKLFQCKNTWLSVMKVSFPDLHNTNSKGRPFLREWGLRLQPNFN